MISDEAPRETWRKRLFWLFRMGVSILLLGVLFWRFDWAVLLQVIHQGQWVYLVGPVLCFWVGFWLSGLRWQAVLRGMNLPLPLRDLLLLNLKGFFWNNFLPSTIGGDGYRFLQLGRLYPQQRAAAFASVVLDRVYGYLALLALHLLLLPFLVPLWVWGWVLLGIEGSVAAGVAALLILWLLRRGWMARLGAWSARLAGVGGKVLRVLAMMAGQRRGTVARGVLYSAGFVVLNALALWFYLRTLAVALPFLPVFYASTLGALLGALPVSLNGLGLMELALVLALSPLGARREEVLLAAFLLRGVNLAMALPGGVLYLWESWRGR